MFFNVHTSELYTQYFIIATPLAMSINICCRKKGLMSRVISQAVGHAVLSRNVYIYRCRLIQESLRIRIDV